MNSLHIPRSMPYETSSWLLQIICGGQLDQIVLQFVPCRNLDVLGHSLHIFFLPSVKNADSNP